MCLKITALFYTKKIYKGIIMSKKIISVLMCILLVFALAGCVEKQSGAIEETENETEILEENKEKLPIEKPMIFAFSSGAGGWATELNLDEDGSFTGVFHDSEMGVVGEENPNGTYYICKFSGKFELKEKINEYTYSLTLKDLETEKEEGTEWIEDGVLYIVSYPYGLDGGNDFLLYTPDCPVEGLLEDFLSWWPERYNMNGTPTVLNRYGIHNLSENYGFFAD